MPVYEQHQYALRHADYIFWTARLLGRLKPQHGTSDIHEVWSYWA